VKVRFGKWRDYLRLAKRQEDERATLHAAVKTASKALRGMIRKESKGSRAALGLTTVEGRYAYAAFYFFKYLIEERAFDDKATPKFNQRVWQFWTRLDGTIGFVSNTCWDHPSAWTPTVALSEFMGAFSLYLGNHVKDLYKMIDYAMEGIKGKDLL
jgi:hypothetical protein